MYSETCTWRDNNIQYNALYRWVLTTQLIWPVPQNGWLFLYELSGTLWRMFQARSSLKFGQTIECGFTLKLVRDMIMTYNGKVIIWKFTHFFVITISKKHSNLKSSKNIYVFYFPKYTSSSCHLVRVAT